MYGLPRCGQPLLNDTRLLWDKLILGHLRHRCVDVQLATQTEGTRNVHLMTSDESTLDGAMLKDKTYLFTRHQPVHRHFTHSVDADGGDAQHRRDGHHRHLGQTQRMQKFMEKEETMQNWKDL